MHDDETPPARVRRVPVMVLAASISLGVGAGAYLFRAELGAVVRGDGNGAAVADSRNAPALRARPKAKARPGTNKGTALEFATDGAAGEPGMPEIGNPGSSPETLSPAEELTLTLAGDVDLAFASPDAFARRLARVGLRPTYEFRGNSGERRTVLVRAVDPSKGIGDLKVVFVEEADGTSHFQRLDARFVGGAARFARLREELPARGEAGWESYVSREGVESWVHPQGWKRWIELRAEEADGAGAGGDGGVEGRETILMALEERME